MPADLPILAVVAVVAIAVALTVFRRTEARDAAGDRATHAHRPGMLAGVVGVVDASIGMFLIRRMLGRSTVTRAESRAERARQALVAADTAQGAAVGRAVGRGGVLGPMTAAPTRLVVAGTAASHTRRDQADRQAHPVAGRTVLPVWASRSRMLPGAVAAAGLVAVAVVAFVMWPRTEGAVLSATGTPELPSPTADLGSAPPAASASPSVTVAPSPTGTPAPTGTPSATDTPSATETPTVPPTATPTAAPTQTPHPTVRPTATPRPTARPTATPTPTVSPSAVPSPSATPDPTPTASPTPTVAPTVAPTPDPPTPEPPTPAPTPEPPSPSP